MRKDFVSVGKMVLAVGVSLWMGTAPVTAAEGPGPWNMGYAFSFIKPTGDSTNVLKDGMGLNFNLGYHQPERLVGVRMDVLYAGFKLQPAVIARLDNASEGNMKVFGGGASVVVSPPSLKRIKPSVYAGPGVYYEHAQATWDEGCDPVFGCPSGGGVTTPPRSIPRGWGGKAARDLILCLTRDWVPSPCTFNTSTSTTATRPPSLSPLTLDSKSHSKNACGNFFTSDPYESYSFFPKIT